MKKCKNCGKTVIKLKTFCNNACKLEYWAKRREVIVDKYLTQNILPSKIAEDLGCSYYTIINILKKEGVYSVRKNSNPVKIKKIKPKYLSMESVPLMSKKVIKVCDMPTSKALRSSLEKNPDVICEWV